MTDDLPSGKVTGFPRLDTPLVQESRSRDEPWLARLIAIPWYQLLITLWNRTGGGSAYVPGHVQPGVFLPFGGTVAPEGYLLCDGTLYPVADFPNLFAAIGYAYGGAGASFAVPDGQNRFFLGAGSRAIGDVGGAETSTLVQANLPNVSLPVTDPGHTHVQNSHNHTQNSHNHTQNSHNHTQNAHTHVQNTHNHTQNSHTHIQNVGTVAGAVLQTGAAIANGVETNAGTTDATIAVNITTVATNQNTTATNQASTATNIATTATNIATTATNQSAVTGITVDTGGTDTPVAIMPPFFVGNWIIKT